MKTLEELKAAYKAANDDFLKIVIAHNIKAVSISDDVINAVITAYNKYAGKKIGPATEKKIDEENQKDFDRFIKAGIDINASDPNGTPMLRYLPDNPYNI